MTSEKPFESERAELKALYEESESLRDVGFGDIADDLGDSLSNFPERLVDAPMIIDTDIGSDPDDAVALVVAALHVPQLRLVITSDEQGGKRADFARALLDALGRPDVVVVRGRELRKDVGLCVGSDMPVVQHRRDVLKAVQEVCGDTGAVRWVGMGPMSNLADLLALDSELRQRLDVTQMGGAINYRRPDQAEHNVRLDVSAAEFVVSNARNLRLVISDVTFREEINIDPSSDLFLGLDSNVEWQKMLRDHFQEWFNIADHQPAGSMQHDAVALSAAMSLPFVRFRPETVAFDDLGRMTVDEDGSPVRLASTVNYEAFNKWLRTSLFAVPSVNR